MFNELVCAYIQYSENESCAIDRVIKTLENDLKNDLTLAFEKSKPLILKYPNIYSQCSSFFEFILNLSNNKSLLKDFSKSSEDKTDIDSLEQCKTQLQHLQTENEQLSSDKDTLKREINNSETKYKQCLKDHAKEKEALELDLKTCQEQTKNLDNQLEDLETKLKNIKSDLKQCITEKGILAKKLDECLSEKNDLDRDLKSCKGEMKTIENDLAKYKMKNTEMETDLEKYKRQKDDLEYKVKKCDLKIMEYEHMSKLENTSHISNIESKTELENKYTNEIKRLNEALHLSQEELTAIKKFCENVNPSLMLNRDSNRYVQFIEQMYRFLVTLIHLSEKFQTCYNITSHGLLDILKRLYENIEESLYHDVFHIVINIMQTSRKELDVTSLDLPSNIMPMQLDSLNLSALPSLYDLSSINFPELEIPEKYHTYTLPSLPTFGTPFTFGSPSISTLPPNQAPKLQLSDPVISEITNVEEITKLHEENIELKEQINILKDKISKDEHSFDFTDTKMISPEEDEILELKEKIKQLQDTIYNEKEKYVTVDAQLRFLHEKFQNVNYHSKNLRDNFQNKMNLNLEEINESLSEITRLTKPELTTDILGIFNLSNEQLKQYIAGEIIIVQRTYLELEKKYLQCKEHEKQLLNEITNLKKHTDVNESVIQENSKLKEQVSALETDLNKKQESLQNIEAKVSALETDLKTKQESLQKLEAKVSTLETDLKTTEMKDSSSKKEVHFKEELAKINLQWKTLFGQAFKCIKKELKLIQEECVLVKFSDTVIQTMFTDIIKTISDWDNKYNEIYNGFDKCNKDRITYKTELTSLREKLTDSENLIHQYKSNNNKFNDYLIEQFDLPKKKVDETVETSLSRNVSDIVVRFQALEQQNKDFIKQKIESQTSSNSSEQNLLDACQQELISIKVKQSSEIKKILLEYFKAIQMELQVIESQQGVYYGYQDADIDSNFKLIINSIRKMFKDIANAQDENQKYVNDFLITKFKLKVSDDQMKSLTSKTTFLKLAHMIYKSSDELKPNYDELISILRINTKRKKLNSSELVKEITKVMKAKILKLKQEITELRNQCDQDKSSDTIKMDTFQELEASENRILYEYLRHALFKITEFNMFKLEKTVFSDDHINKLDTLIKSLENIQANDQLCEILKEYILNDIKSVIEYKTSDVPEIKIKHVPENLPLNIQTFFRSILSEIVKYIHQSSKSKHAENILDPNASSYEYETASDSETEVDEKTELGQTRKRKKKINVS